MSDDKPTSNQANAQTLPAGAHVRRNAAWSPSVRRGWFGNLELSGARLAAKTCLRPLEQTDILAGFAQPTPSSP